MKKKTQLLVWAKKKLEDRAAPILYLTFSLRGIEQNKDNLYNTI